MVKGFVVMANTITGDKDIDESISGFHYDNVDTICIKDDENGNVEINTIDIVRQILNAPDNIDLETLKNMFVDYKNGITPEISNDTVVQVSGEEDANIETPKKRKSILNFLGL